MSDNPTKSGHQNEEQISLRDWFAGMALQGYIACWPADGYQVLNKTAEVAKTAYVIADAMLAERNKE